MPFVVVIDATGGGTEGVPARVVYRKAGFEGVAKLREVIDGITQTSTGRPDTVGATEGKGLPSLPPTPAAGSVGEVWHSVSIDFSTLRAPDILLTDELLEYRQTLPASEESLSLSHGHIGLQYAPELPVEKKKRVEDDQFGFQTSDRVRAGDQLTGLIGGGAYSGYSDYRSLWFNEHFRQLYSKRSGYEEAHPWGCNVSGGARWEYLPAAGFVQGEVTVQHDVISPGYDVSLAKLPLKLTRFRDNYNTLSGRLTLENVLTSRLRALQELQTTDATERQLRFSLQSSLNWAIAEHWVTRFVLTGTREAPRFQSASASAIVARDWHDTWFLSLIARGYWDDGEIENALLVENTADPPLRTLLTGLELRWQGRQSFLKLFAGPYFTDYQQARLAIATFPHLYQDRDWLCVQFAFAHEF